MRYRALLFDGMNALFRAAYVTKPLTVDVAGHGHIPIGGVYGFLRLVLHEVDRRGADGCAVVVCWEGDRDGQSWRRDLFPAYKANRDPERHRKDEKESDIHRQEGILRGVLSELGWSQAWSPGFEADDTLATLAARLEARGPVGIVTGDRDLHQCATARVHALDREVWTPAEVKKKWGVDPVRIPEVKALAGDKSDGIPGVMGIGEKWAREFASAFPSLEALFEFARERYNPEAPVNWPPHAVRKLVDGEQDALLFRRLATVQRDAPLEFAPRTRAPAREVFERFRFASLMAPSTLKIAETIAGS